MSENQLSRGGEENGLDLAVEALMADIDWPNGARTDGPFLRSSSLFLSFGLNIAKRFR